MRPFTVMGGGDESITSGGVDAIIISSSRMGIIGSWGELTFGRIPGTRGGDMV